jgi:hypothetical protein
MALSVMFASSRVPRPVRWASCSAARIPVDAMVAARGSETTVPGGVGLPSARRERRPEAPRYVRSWPGCSALGPKSPKPVMEHHTTWGVASGHGVVAEAEPVELPGAVGLHDDVRPGDEPLEHLRCPVVAQVQGDRPLAPVERDVGGVEAAAVPAAEAVTVAGCLHLHDVRAEVGEEQGAVGTGGEAGQVQDPYAGEGTGHSANEYPPLSGYVWPVIHVAWLLARKTARAATSSGSPGRRTT